MAKSVERCTFVVVHTKVKNQLIMGKHMTKTSKRYIVIGTSITGSMFSATVMDTKQPIVIHGVHYQDNGMKHYHAVCESQDIKDAKMIADALNWTIKRK
jgi:hypothetical protein